MSELDDRPTVLLVGGGERMHTALSEALERHHLMVEAVPTEKIVEAAFAAAPDLLVLLGDAAKDGGEGALSQLSGHAAASMVPVVLLTNEPGLERRLEAFRHGVVAVVPRTASADGMAREIAKVARELPERSGEWGGELGEATVDELVALFSEQLRTGILSVTAKGEGGGTAQVVVRSGRPVAEAIREFVDRLRPLIDAKPGALQYEFHESPGSRLKLLSGDELDAVSTADEPWSARRVILIEQNPARADVLSQELRARGALVAVADGAGNGLDRARGHDPDVAIVAGSGVDGWALDALRTLRRDRRLRWASLLVVDERVLWSKKGAAGEVPNLKRLASALQPLIRHDKQLAERALSQAKFDTRLEQIGPGRSLRALTSTNLGIKLSVKHPRVRVEIDLAEGIVVGARAFLPGKDEQIAEGPSALAALIAIDSGRMRVERKEAPSATNVMAPVDDALAAANHEKPPIRPSKPPPSVVPSPKQIAKFDERPTGKRSLPAKPIGSGGEAAAGPPGRDPEKLVGQLEKLLSKLETIVPAAEAAAETIVRVSQRPPRRDLTPIHPLPIPGSRRSMLRSPSKPLASERPLTSETKNVGTAASPPWEPAVGGGIVDIPEEVTRIEEAPQQETLMDMVPAGMPPPPPTEPASGQRAEPAAETEPAVVDAAVLAAAVEPEPFQLPRNWIPVIGIAAVGALVFVCLAGSLIYAVARPDPIETVASADDTNRPTLAAEGAPGTAPSVAEVNDVAPTPVVQPEPAPAPVPEPVVDPTPAPEISPEPEVAPTPPIVAEAAPAPVAPPEPRPERQTPVAEPEPEAAPSSPPSQTIAQRAATSRDVPFLIRTANFQRQHSELRSAERLYVRVLHLSANNSRALAGLTRVAMVRRDGTQAVRWARRLAETRPGNPNNHVLLGDAYQVAGNRSAAVRAWRHALTLHPGHRGARRRLGRR